MDLKLIVIVACLFAGLFVFYFLGKILLNNILYVILGIVLIGTMAIFGFIAYKIYNAKKGNSDRVYASLLIFLFLGSFIIIPQNFVHAEVLEPTARITQSDLQTMELNLIGEIGTLREEMKQLKEAQIQKDQEPEEEDFEMVNVVFPIILMQILSTVAIILYIRLGVDFNG